DPPPAPPEPWHATTPDLLQPSRRMVTGDAVPNATPWQCPDIPQHMVLVPALLDPGRRRPKQHDPGASGGDPGRPVPGGASRLAAAPTSRDDHGTTPWSGRTRTVSHHPVRSPCSGHRTAVREPSTWRRRSFSAMPTAAGRCWPTTSIAICTPTPPPS